jgi:RHS repeat-associated protein
VENGETFKQSYNAENRLYDISKMDGDCATGTILESWLFSYDGDGNRVAQLYTDLSTSSTLTTLYYFGGAYETTLETGAVRKYYSFAGQTIAMRDDDGLKYFLTDHLGSIVAVTDESGEVLSQQRYLPFGQMREDVGSIAQTDFSYTGQRSLPEMGLMDYKARMYSSSLMRFIQPDSLIPSLFNPQSLNRYSYVTNRPIIFNDPTGNKPCDEEFGCSGPLPKPIRPPNDDDIPIEHPHGRHGGDDNDPNDLEDEPSAMPDLLLLDVPEILPIPFVNPYIDPFSNPFIDRSELEQYLKYCAETGTCMVAPPQGIPGKLRWDPSGVNGKDLLIDYVGLVASFFALKWATDLTRYGSFTTTGISIGNSFAGDDLTAKVLSLAALFPPISVYASAGSVINDISAGFYFEPLPLQGPPRGNFCEVGGYGSWDR